MVAVRTLSGCTARAKACQLRARRRLSAGIVGTVTDAGEI